MSKFFQAGTRRGFQGGRLRRGSTGKVMRAEDIEVLIEAIATGSLP